MKAQLDSTMLNWIIILLVLVLAGFVAYMVMGSFDKVSFS